MLKLNLPKATYRRFRKNVRRKMLLNAWNLRRYRYQLEGCRVLMGGIVIERREYVRIDEEGPGGIKIIKYVPRSEMSDDEYRACRQSSLNFKSQIALKIFDFSGTFMVSPCTEDDEVRRSLEFVGEGDEVYIVGNVLCLPGMPEEISPEILLCADDLRFSRIIPPKDRTKIKRNIKRRLSRLVGKFSPLGCHFERLEVLRCFLRKEPQADEYSYWLFDIEHGYFSRKPTYPLAYLMFKTYKKVFGMYGTTQTFFDMCPNVEPFREYLMGAKDGCVS